MEQEVALHDLAQQQIQLARQRHQEAAKEAKECAGQTPASDMAREQLRFPADVQALEVTALGSRARVVVSGRLAETPEGAFEAKAVALKGIPGVEHLVEGHRACVQSFCGLVYSFSRPNQDDYFYVATSDGYQLVGMFDGHGRDGHKLAATVRNRMLRHLVSALPSADSDRSKQRLNVKTRLVLREAFNLAQQELDALDGVDTALSGVAACLLVINRKRQLLYAASVGNVRCILAEALEDAEGKSRRKQKLTVVPFTEDHTLESRKERRRVEKTDAEVLPARSGKLRLFVRGEEWPGIPLTRCLGNAIAHRLGVTMAADIEGKDLKETMHFLVVATDGIWGVLQEQEVVDMVAEARKDNVEYGVSAITTRARKQWSTKSEHAGIVDDMTICVVWF